MAANVIVLLSYLWLTLLTRVHGTHFRGAHFWFKSLKNEERSVELNFWISWQESVRFKTTCNQQTIASGGLIGGEAAAGHVICLDGCNETLGTVVVRCIQYNSIDRWMLGVRAYNVTFPGNAQFVIGWQGTGWIDNIMGAETEEWRFKTTLTTGFRNDTKQNNNSPRSLSPPVIHIERGCNVIIDLKAVDDDNDIIRCRWARRDQQECGGICFSFPGAILNESVCTMQYDQNRLPGTYVAAVQIEDYRYTPDQTLIGPFSSVPLQILVIAHPTTTTSCRAKPSFVEPTPSNNRCFTVASHLSSQFTIVILPKHPEATISIVNLWSMPSVNYSRSELYYRNTTQRYYVDVTLPGGQQRDKIYRLCFQALDIFDQSTEERCVNIDFSSENASVSDCLDITSQERLNSSTTSSAVGKTDSLRELQSLSEANSTWTYRWLIVIFVATPAAVALVILVAVLVVKLQKSNDDEHQQLHPDYQTNSLQSVGGGIHNWSYLPDVKYIS